MENAEKWLELGDAVRGGTRLHKFATVMVAAGTLLRT